MMMTMMLLATTTMTKMMVMKTMACPKDPTERSLASDEISTKPSLHRVSTLSSDQWCENSAAVETKSERGVEIFLHPDLHRGPRAR
jgi:hypothetical protein